MAETKVLSELNGTVWKIESAPGDRVAEGDTLILLESMKMEIPVMAPKDGVVKEILVKEEQAVTEGEVLATME
ncbi:MAG: biotin/lipoyl-binding carrier protein [Alphaproteobacteria bacterium]|jgi:acetyl-CoA carboxylase biotin carboxyl carrier protein|nr:biotin/lipoyl-binding carrier protein [Alphaproteobacteria bacterium]